MPRKNSRGKHRRGYIETVLLETPRDWVVTLTNGSGTTTVELTGTRESAWRWAATAGAIGGIKPGFWYPVYIRMANDIVYTEDFVSV